MTEAPEMREEAEGRPTREQKLAAASLVVVPIIGFVLMISTTLGLLALAIHLAGGQ